MKRENLEPKNAGSLPNQYNGRPIKYKELENVRFLNFESEQRTKALLQLNYLEEIGEWLKKNPKGITEF